MIDIKSIFPSLLQYSTYISKFIIMSVTVNSYMIYHQLNISSNHYAVGFKIPFDNVGIYFGKLLGLRSLIMTIGSTLEFTIYSTLKSYLKIASFSSFCLMILFRLIYLIILYFSNNIAFHAYIILNLESFFFGYFQVSLLSYTLDIPSFRMLIVDFSAVLVCLIGILSNLCFYNKPLLIIKFHCWISVITGLCSILLWYFYLFCFNLLFGSPCDGINNELSEIIETVKSIIQLIECKLTSKELCDEINKLNLVQIYQILQFIDKLLLKLQIGKMSLPEILTLRESSLKEVIINVLKGKLDELFTKINELEVSINVLNFLSRYFNGNNTLISTTHLDVTANNTFIKNLGSLNNLIKTDLGVKIIKSEHITQFEDLFHKLDLQDRDNIIHQIKQTNEILKIIYPAKEGFAKIIQTLSVKKDSVFNLVDKIAETNKITEILLSFKKIRSIMPSIPIHSQDTINIFEENALRVEKLNEKINVLYSIMKKGQFSGAELDQIDSSYFESNVGCEIYDSDLYNRNPLLMAMYEVMKIIKTFTTKKPLLSQSDYELIQQLKVKISRLQLTNRHKLYDVYTGVAPLIEEMITVNEIKSVMLTNKKLHLFANDIIEKIENHKSVFSLLNSEILYCDYIISHINSVKVYVNKNHFRMYKPNNDIIVNEYMLLKRIIGLGPILCNLRGIYSEITMNAIKVKNEISGLIINTSDSHDKDKVQKISELQKSIEVIIDKESSTKKIHLQKLEKVVEEQVNNKKKIMTVLSEKITQLESEKNDIESQIQVQKTKKIEIVNTIQINLNEIDKRGNDVESNLSINIFKFFNVLSQFMLFVGGSIFRDFLYPCVMPYAILNLGHSYFINMITPIFQIIGSIAVCYIDTNFQCLKEWKIYCNLSWTLLVPQFIVFILSLSAIHSKVYFFHSIVNSSFRIAILIFMLIISSSIMQSISYVSISNYIYHNTISIENSMILLYVHNIFSTFCRFLFFKLSVGYNSTRVDVGYCMPNFVPDECNLSCGYWIKNILKRALVDDIFDISMNIEDYD